MKETVYLAGKITGDPYYRSKFRKAACELAAAGFVVVNPAKLPAEGFTWEAYMRMSSAMLDECAAVCFLPDWTESRGALMEFGRAKAKEKRVFMFDEWKAERSKKTPDCIFSDKETPLIAVRCFKCGEISVYPASRADGRTCAACGGQAAAIGYARR